MLHIDEWMMMSVICKIAIFCEISNGCWYISLRQHWMEQFVIPFCKSIGRSMGSTLWMLILHSNNWFCLDAGFCFVHIKRNTFTSMTISRHIIFLIWNFNFLLISSSSMKFNRNIDAAKQFICSSLFEPNGSEIENEINAIRPIGRYRRE